MRLAACAVAMLAGACSPPGRPPAGGDGPPPIVVDGPPDAWVDVCKIGPDDNAVGACDRRAPPGSFDPVVQWAWTGPPGFTRSIITPLVANLTDDNGDGAIDLCDTPDVVVVASPQSGQPGSIGRIFVLDGKYGTLHFEIPVDVDGTVTPALGDLDHDGVPEIVAVDPIGRIVIFDHTGALVHGPAGAWSGSRENAALALADLDHDGEVEILGGVTVFDARGEVKWAATTSAPSMATTAADLDGDGYLEVVFGHAAYRHDGTLYWDTGLAPGFPAIANLDDDEEPEVLLTNRDGVSLIDHDGHVQYRDRRAGPGIWGLNAWMRPAAIHDFDGDGRADFAMCTQTYFHVFSAQAEVKWSTPVSDNTGVASSTAFDFLGDGRAEAVFADEQRLFVFGDTGAILYERPRPSGTLIEYPTIADVDNDGSAEIVIVSNTYPGLPQQPTVQVLRDREDRWIQARRIWNQHTYHVTNVREDGTIPAHEPPSWKRLNTFRTNAQINGSAVCDPVR
ncbi:MAG: hypothetical protein KF773_03080 [Deltaproteobacteria bacterium]|nr:hypothetical protein [Deltaproteobacteria bacterium]